MSTSRRSNTQNEGQYHALIVERKGTYEIRAFDDAVDLLRDAQKSISQGYSPLTAFEDVSWKAIRDLEIAVQQANNGFEVDFKTVLSTK